jgi:uncharacterized protein YndB with AHSA1/START domain
MDKPQFVYVTYIATTPEKLWEALTVQNAIEPQIIFGNGRNAPEAVVRL